MEHSINHDGQSNIRNYSNDISSCDSVFLEVSENCFVPRCISIDLEPTVIDEIRTGIYRELFNPSQLISGLEDSASNYARGHFTIGKLYFEEFMNTLRHIISLCDSLQGFMVVQSFGGGCGSGFTSLIMEQISIEYNKKSKMQFSLVPSSNLSPAIVEPYNIVLSSKICIETTDLCFQHDNQSLYNVAFKALEVPSPTFTNVNRILAQVFSSLTISMRHENALNNDLDQIATNLIPFPRLHYPLDIYSPICNLNFGTHTLFSTSEITKDLFTFHNRLLDCDFLNEKFLSCCLQYRGSVYPSEVNKAILEIKRLDYINFVDWCPTGYKVGISKYPTVAPKNSCFYDCERSVLLLCNNTSFHQKIGKLGSTFDRLFTKRSFLHWYVGEGMEEGEFVEAREDFSTLQEDYKCVAENETKKMKGETTGINAASEVEIDNTDLKNDSIFSSENEIYKYTEKENSQKYKLDTEKENLLTNDNDKFDDLRTNSSENLVSSDVFNRKPPKSKNKTEQLKSSDRFFIEDSREEKERNTRLINFLKQEKTSPSDITTLS